MNTLEESKSFSVRWKESGSLVGFSIVSLFIVLITGRLFVKEL